MVGRMSETYSRRIVFSGLGALGVAAALAGCGSDSGTPGGSTDTASSGGGASAGGAAGTTLVATADVPVGGGVVLTDQHIVITQPTAGDFKAFSSRCLHQGFDVSSVKDNTIRCAVHGSTYDAATGAVEGGPAPSGAKLAAVSIKVDGANIVTA